MSVDRSFTGTAYDSLLRDAIELEISAQAKAGTVCSKNAIVVMIAINVDAPIKHIRLIRHVQWEAREHAIAHLTAVRARYQNVDCSTPVDACSADV